MSILSNWLKKNKIFFETITATLLAIMAIFVSCTQTKIARNQMALSVVPIVFIEPAKIVKGTTGEFTLFLKNDSPAELYDIGINEDYFVSSTSEDGQTTLRSFGALIVWPQGSIERLKSGGRKSFTISFKTICEQMDTFFNSKDKGMKMKIVRLTVEFRRKLDGRKFRYLKAYVITGNDNLLLDYDQRDIRVPEMPVFGEIKKLLGVVDN